MKFKNLHKFILALIIISNTFAGTLGKSHSAELLSRGRSVPMSISNDTLVIAKTFSSLLPRTVDIYDVDKNASILTKIGELNSPNPMPGDDFGYSLDISGDYLIIGSPGHNDGHGAAYLFKRVNDNWEIHTVFTNPVASENKGFPHKFGYSVNLSDNYLSISYFAVQSFQQTYCD